MKKPVVFLDRDGTLIEEVNFLLNEQQIKVWPNAIHAMKLLRHSGFLLLVLSNQSGVARGYLTEERVLDLNHAVFDQMRLMGEVPDGFFYCPFHPEAKLEKYRRETDMRKPGPGMAFLAAQQFAIDLQQAYSVGDKLADVKLAQNLGGQGVLVLTGHGREEQARIGREENIYPDFVADHILDAAAWIAEHYKAKHRPQTRE